MFHLLLLAGTLKTCVHQEDVISQCLFRNVILQHNDVSSGCLAVVWNGKGAAPKREAPNTDGMLHVTMQVNACASYTMYFATEHPSSPEVCWSKLIEAVSTPVKWHPLGSVLTQKSLQSPQFTGYTAPCVRGGCTASVLE